MSEVYIRSQDKEKIYKMGDFYAKLEYRLKRYRTGEDLRDRSASKHIIAIVGVGRDLEEIAEYESRERCIEVLDDILTVCGQYLYAKGSTGFVRGSVSSPPVAAIVPRIYQMPEQ